MQLIKNNSAPSPLAHRLAQCVDRVGGKRAMATATLISEAQLFRYLNGDSDLPAERLVAIAKAANVDAGWLLTGLGDMVEGVKTDARPVFRSELMVQVTQTLEELLVEFEKGFKPRQKARALTLIYNALRHEESVRQAEYIPDKMDMLTPLHFLSSLRTEEELEALNNALTLLEYSEQNHEFSQDELELLRFWCNLLVRGMKGFYSSYLGQVYFERKSTTQLDSPSILELQNLVVKACRSTGKNQLDWLDLGCGNGRHLAHIAAHFPNVQAKGLELSELGYTKCIELMNAERIPEGTVVMGDMRQLPYPKDSFDVVFANLSLHSLPYLPNTGLGIEEVMAEVTRITRQNGLIKLVFPYGNWRDYSLPMQYMNEELFQRLAKHFQLEIHDIEIERTAPPPECGGIPAQLKLNHHEFIHITLRKA